MFEQEREDTTKKLREKKFNIINIVIVIPNVFISGKKKLGKSLFGGFLVRQFGPVVFEKFCLNNIFCF